MGADDRTVGLEQVSDIKTSMRADVKQALTAWVANGNKLIISDAESEQLLDILDHSLELADREHNAMMERVN